LEFPRKTLKHATLNPARLNAAGIITPESERLALVEQFRVIKRPVLMKAARSSDNRVLNGNLVLVTSAVPGEGKTFTAVNLAMSIAMELDHTVLLVDADAAKSDVSRLLGIQEPEGLSDYLAQPERALSEFLVGTDIPKLTVLPAGSARANITELLASDHMRNLVDEFGRRYTDRVVIIDSPPLLAASGASVLAHLVGQTVFVVEAIRTPQSAVREGLALLKDVRNVGLVLNKNRSKEGLVYQYGSYYAHSSDVR
jgi:exopolysaccharide/PEP-CTERM locus tyrosine autokinase